MESLTLLSVGAARRLPGSFLREEGGALEVLGFRNWFYIAQGSYQDGLWHGCWSCFETTCRAGRVGCGVRLGHCPCECVGVHVLFSLNRV
jgi:hypothetical protein